MLKNYLVFFYLRWIKRITTPAGLVRFAVKKNNGATVLIDGDRSFTINEVNSNANKLCSYFSSKGLRKGDRVGVWLKNRKEYIEIRLACYKAGYVFMALIDDFSFRQGLDVLNDTECKILIFDNRLHQEQLQEVFRLSMVEDAVSTDKFPSDEKVTAYEDILSQNKDDEPDVKIKPDEISAIGFTSGTTGKSKGVVWSHNAWLNSFFHFVLNSDGTSLEDAVFLHVVPFSTAGSLVILPSLVSGAKSILLPSFNVEEVADTIDKMGVTHLVLPPSFLIQLWDFFESRKPAYHFKSIRNISVGSAILPGAKWAEMVKTFGPVIQQSYGMAEVLAPLAFLRITNPEGQKDLLTSVGKTIPQVKIEVIDKAQNNPGILKILSKTCALGYWKQPELTRQFFENGWFVTTDLGYVNQEGYLFIKGRAAHVINYKNNTLNPRDIEEVIHEFPGVKEVCMLTRQDKLLVVLTQRTGYTVDVSELKAFCSKRLDVHPDEFAIIDTLPCSTSGKILRDEILKNL